MAKIGIVAKVDKPTIDLLRAIAPHASGGIAELASRFRDDGLIIDLEYTGPNWEENHESLRAAVAELQKRGIPFQLWESSDDDPPLDGHEIEPTALENILCAHARDHEDS